MDGARLSQDLVADQLTPEQRHRAARATAGHATGAADLAELLDMLGLTARDGLRPPAEQNRPPAPDPEEARRLAVLERCRQLAEELAAARAVRGGGRPARRRVTTHRRSAPVAAGTR